MQFDAELLLLAMAPVFLACIGWEAWHLARTRRADRLYSWPDTLCNAALALMHQGADKLAWLAVVPVYAYVYAHFRLFTWNGGALSFAVLFLAQSKSMPGQNVVIDGGEHLVKRARDIAYE